MLRWHPERGNKEDVIYHSVAIALYSIALIVITIYCFVTWINDELNAGLLVVFLIALLFQLMHKMKLNENVCVYAKYNTYKKNNYSLFDRYVILIMNHYIKKWKPEPFMCCSFKHIEPEIAYKSFDFKEIKFYGAKDISYDACYLYQCKKCNNYVLSLEYHKDKHYAYIPIACAKDADTYSKEWSYYHMRTTHPILHIIDNKYTWENKA